MQDNIEKKGIFISSLKMGVATLTSRILGLVREQVMAYAFGASAVTDAFLVAYRIPNLLRDLFAEGAFSSAFVPTFAELKQSGSQKARELFWSLFFLLSLVTGGISLLICFFSAEMITLFAPSFKDDPWQFQFAVNMTKMMAPYLLFVSLAALCMGALNSLKSFFVPSMAPAAYNVVMIISILLFPVILEKWGYTGAYALGIGVALGGMMQVVIQLPYLWKKDYGIIRPTEIYSPHAKKVFKMLGPGLVGFAAAQLNILVTTILASGIAGAVSWLNFAFRLFQFPVGIISVSLASSNHVHFSECWKKGESQKALEYLRTSFSFSLFALLPIMGILLAFSFPLVHLVFERGKFQVQDTLMTAQALRLYLLGLPFYGVSKLLVPIFYTVDKQKIPVVISLLTVGSNIIFCLLFISHYGFAVMALGTTLSMFFNALLLGFLAAKEFKFPLSFYFNLKILKVSVATVGVFLFCSLWADKIFKSEKLFSLKCGQIVSGSLLGGVLYLVLLYLCGEKYFFLLLAKKLKIRRK